MAFDRLEWRARGPIVQKRTSHAKSPKRGRTDFVRERGALGNSVAGADVVEQQIREEGHCPPIEQRKSRGPGFENRNMTGGAANLSEHSFTRLNPFGEEGFEEEG